MPIAASGPNILSDCPFLSFVWIAWVALLVSVQQIGDYCPCDGTFDKRNNWVNRAMSVLARGRTIVYWCNIKLTVASVDQLNVMVGVAGLIFHSVDFVDYGLGVNLSSQHLDFGQDVLTSTLHIAFVQVTDGSIKIFSHY